MSISYVLAQLSTTSISFRGYCYGISFMDNFLASKEEDDVGAASKQEAGKFDITFHSR